MAMKGKQGVKKDSHALSLIDWKNDEWKWAQSEGGDCFMTRLLFENC